MPPPQTRTLSLITLALSVAAPCWAAAQSHATLGPSPQSASPAAQAHTSDAEAKDNLSTGGSSSALHVDAWHRDDWMLIRPKVSLIEVTGYFRVRGDVMRKLDFNNGSVWEYDNATPLPRYAALTDGHAEYTQAAMRLRFEPRLNVRENIELTATIDIFDNLVLGSTPTSLAPSSSAMMRTPTPIMARGQAPAQFGVNTLSQTLAVKRLWARLHFLNDMLELRIGRMPDHFGLGMWYNSGDCLDCDWGNVVDRVAVGVNVLGHTFEPQFDWISRGPLRRTFGMYDPVPIDAIGWDATSQYGLKVYKQTSPQDVEDRLAHKRPVMDYGLSNALRLQNRDVPLSYYNYALPFSPVSDPLAGAAIGSGERRDALIYQGDVYGRLMLQHLVLTAEFGIIAGSFKDFLSTADIALQKLTTTKVVQLAGAAEATYYFHEDRHGPRLGLKLGGASGDGHRGFGALDLSDTQRGPTATGIDRSLHNFQMSPDYHLDLILFRRLLGGVTDAWYISPEFAYQIDEKLSGRLAAVYSQAITASSSAAADASGGAGHAPLGVELDGEIFYGLTDNKERGALLASVAGGVLFPLSGFDNPTRPVGQQGGSFAWTTQARVYLTF